MLYAKKG